MLQNLWGGPLVRAGRPRPALRPQNQVPAHDEGRRGRRPRTGASAPQLTQMFGDGKTKWHCPYGPLTVAARRHIFSGVFHAPVPPHFQESDHVTKRPHGRGAAFSEIVSLLIMQYRLRKARGALAVFVDALWSYEGPPQPHQRERLLPDASMSLVGNLPNYKGRGPTRPSHASF